MIVVSGPMVPLQSPNRNSDRASRCLRLPVGWTDSSLRYRSRFHDVGSGKTSRCVSADRLWSASTMRIALVDPLRSGPVFVVVMREACQIEGSLRWTVASTVERNPMDKPEIDFFDPEPPSDLVATDITEGDGAEAKSGDTVSVHYVGVAHSTGEEFDASYNRGTPLQFRLGVGQVISGWDQGVQA